MKSRTRERGPAWQELGSCEVNSICAAFDSYKIGVALCDKRLQFIAVNPALAEIHNLPLEDHLGKMVHDVLGTIAAKDEQLLDYVFNTGQSLSNVALSGRLTNRLDEGHWIKNYFPLKDNHGDVVQVGKLVLELKSTSPVLGSPAHPLDPANPENPRDNAQEFRPEVTYQREFAEAHPTFAPVQCPGIVLSGREQEVLQLLATGKSNKEISSILIISVKTVETYRSRVMLKLNAPSLTHLIHYAIRNGIVNLQV